MEEIQTPDSIQLLGTFWSLIVVWGLWILGIIVIAVGFMALVWARRKRRKNHAQPHPPGSGPHVNQVKSKKGA